MLSRASELFRPVSVDPWPEAGIEVELSADADERQALCRRLGLLGLDALRARGRLERSPDGKELHLRATLEAEAVQPCVVSLEPVRSHLLEPIERRWRLPGQGPLKAAAGEAEVLVDPEAVEVEPLEGRVIDLGEVVAEELALALDPYPRLEDAYERLPELGPDISVGEDEVTEGPFAVLQQLEEKRRR
jgi:uncharacterized metal-binding protein YceD (DUF177 family)